MRIVFVWITAIVLLTSITTGWLISNTLVNTIAAGNAEAIGTTGQPFNLLKLIEYVNIAWGPIFDILVVFWALTYPAERDAYSY